MRLACSRCCKLVPEVKEGCSRRASWLNMLTRPGKFEYSEEHNIKNGDIIESLTLEWRRFIGILRSAIVQKPRTRISQSEVCFQKERVKIRSHSYLTFDTSSLLQLFIFGKGFSKLKNQEIIPKTEN